MRAIANHIIAHDPYPLPLYAGAEETVKAGIKQHRSLGRLRITIGGGPGNKYVELARHFCFLLDVWLLVHNLPTVQRLIVEATMLGSQTCPGSDALAPALRARKNQSITDEAPCAACGEWWPVNRGNRFVEHDRHLTDVLVGAQLGLDRRMVVKLRREAVKAIAERLWPPAVEGS